MRNKLYCCLTIALFSGMLSSVHAGQITPNPNIGTITVDTQDVSNILNPYNNGTNSGSTGIINITSTGTFTNNGTLINNAGSGLYNGKHGTGTNTFDGGTLNNNGTLTNYGNLESLQGTINNSGIFTSHGDIWLGGPLINNSSGTLELFSKLAFITYNTNNPVLKNYGHIDVFSDGLLYTEEGEFTNYIASTVNIHAGGHLDMFEMYLYNYGTVTIDTDGKMDHQSANSNHYPLYNYGILSNNGALGSRGPLGNYGNLYNNGVLTNGALTNGMIPNDSSTELDVLTNETGGTLTNDTNGALTNLNHAKMINNGLIINKGTVTNNGTFTNNNTLINNGTLTNNKDLELWNSSTLTNNGTLTNNQDLMLWLSSTLNNNTNSILNNNGYLYSHTSTINNDGQLTNNVNGTLDIVLNSSVTNSGQLTSYGKLTSDGTVTNTQSGTIHIEGPSAKTNIAVVDNYGTFEVHNSTVTFGTFNNYGTYTSDPSKSYFTDLIIGDHGSLKAGSGDVFDISGKFMNYNQNAADFDVSGADLVFSGTGSHTLITFSSLWWKDLAFSGTLTIELLNGAVLHLTELGSLNLYGIMFRGYGTVTWDNTIEADGISGSFTAGNGTAPVPEPATMALFGSGLASLIAAYRRRR